LDTLRATVDSPAPVLEQCALRYGDPFRIVTRNGCITYTGHPEAIRAIYTAAPDSFEPNGVDITKPIFGLNGLTVVSGQRHRRDRKLLSGPFGPSAMRAYGPTIAEIATKAAARLPAGRPFSMVETTQDIALDVIIRVVFGVEGESRIRLVRDAVLGLIHALNPVVIFYPALRRSFGGIGPWARLLKATSRLHALLAQEISARRQVAEQKSDILSLLLRARYDDGSAMAEPDLIDQLQTLLFAGHETTAMALAWAFYHLQAEPEIHERALAELDALGPNPDPNAFASLPYLEAVCQETLRLHPPVVDVSRMTRAPFDLMGYTIPTGEGITPSPLLLHAREDIYPEPRRFRPTRFLERSFSPFEYIPFGGGARRCLGAAFAMYEMKIVLGTIFRAYRMRLATDAPLAHVRRGITMGPRGPVPMVLLGRRAAHVAEAKAA